MGRLSGPAGTWTCPKCEVINELGEVCLCELPAPKKTEGAPLKFDKEKVRLELLPPEFLWGVASVLTFGAKKYSAGNWAVGEGFDWSRLYGALLRHMTAWGRGEDLDPESGLSHLYHAGCMLAFLAAHVERGLGKDDRSIIGIKKREKTNGNTYSGGQGGTS